MTTDSERRVFFVMLLTGGFMVAEAAGGLLAGSLALIADAGHMLTDTAALAFAWVAFRMARRPSDARRSYGWHRFQVLAAFVNGLALLGISAWIAVEAARRLAAPVEVLGGPMLAIAVLGLLVNIAAFLILHRGDRENLNMRGAVLHDLDVGQLREAIHAAVPQVEDVHHVHAWSLTAERPLVTLHVTVGPEADPAATLAAVQAVLRARFGLAHATVQLEHGGCPDREPVAAGSHPPGREAGGCR